MFCKHGTPTSSTKCQHAFKVQNLIKSKVGNRLGNKNLEAILQIALEGPDEGADDTINDDGPH